MTHTRQALCFFGVLGLLLLPGLAVGAETGSLAERVRAYYRDAGTLETTAVYALSVKQGEWEDARTWEERVALDRSAERLRISTEQWRLGLGEKQLQAFFEQAPDYHIAAPLNWPWTYESLANTVPAMHPAPPEVVWSFAENPAGVFSDGQATVFDEDLAAGTLAVNAAQGRYTFAVDPDSGRLLSATLVVDAKHLSSPEDRASLAWTPQEQRRGEPVDASRWEMALGQSEAVPSLQALVAKLQAQRPGHALVGQPAPPIEARLLDGKSYKLADEPAQVVLIDFWATWCPPCVEGLPKIQAIADWARQEGKSVAVYALNVGEEAEQIHPFVQKHGLKLPVILDPTSALSQAYQVSGIPQTVLISQGKVQKVHVGLSPDLEAQLKAEIEQLLAAAE